MALQIEEAAREKIPAKIALIGPSGSGKTYSALRIATGMGGKIVLINTEGKRGYLYANEFAYSIINLTDPFTPEQYIEAIALAEKSGASVIIIDSGTHEWKGRGGCIEILDKTSGTNSYTKWAKVTPRHNAFVDKQLYSPCHIISCLRGKDQYVLEDVNGKSTPKKVGMGPEQRENYEYEFITTLMLDQKTHLYDTSKDNTHLFEGKNEVLSEEHGRILLEWCETGVVPTAPAKPQPAPQQVAAQPPAQQQRQPSAQQSDKLPWPAFWAHSHELGVNKDKVNAIAKDVFGLSAVPANLVDSKNPENSIVKTQADLDRLSKAIEDAAKGDGTNAQ